MSLTLPAPGKAYDQNDEAQARRKLSEADDLNQKKNEDFIIRKNRLILTSPDGTRWSGTIDNSGTVTWAAL